MRVAVISDIHANLHALEAVLAEIVREEADEIWCLGDVVGYGPQPNECCALVRKRAVFSLCGNHDLAVVGRHRPVGLQRRRGRRGAVDARRPRARPRGWLRSLTAAGTRAGVEALPREPARPGLGLRALRRDRAREPRVDHRTAGARRPQPRRPRRLARRRPPGRRAGRRLDRDRVVGATLRCSTPDRWASRATATRGPPGSRSTSRRDGVVPADGVRRRPPPRTRSRAAACRRFWPSGSRTALSRPPVVIRPTTRARERTSRR